MDGILHDNYHDHPAFRFVSSDQADGWTVCSFIDTTSWHSNRSISSSESCGTRENDPTWSPSVQAFDVDASDLSFGMGTDLSSTRLSRSNSNRSFDGSILHPSHRDEYSITNDRPLHLRSSTEKISSKSTSTNIWLSTVNLLRKGTISFYLAVARDGDCLPDKWWVFSSSQQETSPYHPLAHESDIRCFACCSFFKISLEGNFFHTQSLLVNIVHLR